MSAICRHRVESEFQSEPTYVRVLSPNQIDALRPLRTLYVLPVEPREDSEYGDGLAEIERLDLHNQHGLLCAATTFSDWPWYADHPTDAGKRQETYFLRDVLPMIESNYPVRADRSGRLLLGFSKSGWGAFSLLLRWPDLFERAAAFDAPMAMKWPTKYESLPIFGTAENFEKYRIRSLLAAQANSLRSDKQTRLMVLGSGNFRMDHDKLIQWIDELQIPMRKNASNPMREHTWSSGWVEGAAAFLAGE